MKWYNLNIDEIIGRFIVWGGLFLIVYTVQPEFIYKKMGER